MVFRIAARRCSAAVASYPSSGSSTISMSPSLISTSAGDGASPSLPSMLPTFCLWLFLCVLLMYPPTAAATSAVVSTSIGATKRPLGAIPVVRSRSMDARLREAARSKSVIVLLVRVVGADDTIFCVPSSLSMLSRSWFSLLFSSLLFLLFASSCCFFFFVAACSAAFFCCC